MFLNSSFLAICAVCFTTAVSYSAFYLYPAHLHSIGLDADEIGFVMAGFFAGAVVGLPLAALVMRRVGGQALAAMGLLCLFTAALLFALAPSMWVLCLLRGLQGIGASAANVGGLVLATAIAPKRLAQAGALTGLSFVLGQGLGPSLAAEIITQSGSFLVVEVSAAVVALLGLLCVPLLPAPRSSPLRFERSVWRAAVPALAATWVLTAPFLAIVSLLAAYSTVASTFFVGQMISSVVVRLAAGGLLDRFPRSLIIAVAGLAAGLACICLTFSSPNWIAVSGAMFGIANSAYVPSLQALVIERVGDRIAAATAFRLTVESAGITGALLGGVAAGFLSYFWLFVAAAVLSAIGGVIVLMAKPSGRAAFPS